MICADWMGPEDDGRACAIAPRRASDGDTLIRFAHETCSPSSVIDVEELPEVGEQPPASAELEWALSVRSAVLPMVVLVWDLERIEQLDVRDRALLASLRLDGLSGEQPLETIKAPHVSSVSVTRDAAALRISTRHGSECLELGDQQAARPALQLAAQRPDLNGQEAHARLRIRPTALVRARCWDAPDQRNAGAMRTAAFRQEANAIATKTHDYSALWINRPSVPAERSAFLPSGLDRL